MSSLNSQQAVVMVASVDAVLAAAPIDHNWLSPSEAARVARLRVPARRQHYLAGHWLLRTLLADEFAAAPGDIQLLERDGLPPAVEGADLQLSLSHSGDWIAAAWSKTAIGIDLEQRGRRPALGRFAQLLLAADDDPERIDDDGLLQRWVVKEALIKRAHGSALPEQLAALRLRRVSADHAHVELLSSTAFHLAISARQAYRCRVDQPILSRQYWALDPAV